MLDQENALTRDVYAHFGLAYYMAEVLHRELVNAFAVLSSEPEWTTRPMVDERTVVAEKMTLGELVPRVKGLLPDDFHAALDWALVQRNYLAHGFWYERIHQMTTTDGMVELIEFLSIIREKLDSLNEGIHAVVVARLREAGMTDEQWQEGMELCRHQPPEPLPLRRALKSEERLEIVDAWIVEGMLVLKEQGGELWQLADLGLGWCNLKPDASWKRSKKLKDFLPASIVGRPKHARQWAYSLHVSSGALIRVLPDSTTKRIEWRVEPTPKK